MTEAQHQTAVIKWANLSLKRYPELALLHHIPNGGSRNKLEAINLKRQGVKAGVPDLHLPVSRGEYHGLYIEMKTPTGKTSDHQIWWIEQLTEQGHFVEVCHGWQSAVRVIEWYMNLKGETK